MNDDRIRIGPSILGAANIPYDHGCWVRSGLHDQELRDEARSLLLPGDDPRNIAAAIQAVALKHYLDELLLDEVITKEQRVMYLRQWANMPSTPDPSTLDVAVDDLLGKFNGRGGLK